MPFSTVRDFRSKKENFEGVLRRVREKKNKREKTVLLHFRMKLLPCLAGLALGSNVLDLTASTFQVQFSANQQFAFFLHSEYLEFLRF